jgi:hypothetical protein
MVYATKLSYIQVPRDASARGGFMVKFNRKITFGEMRVMGVRGVLVYC